MDTRRRRDQSAIAPAARRLLAAVTIGLALAAGASDVETRGEEAAMATTDAETVTIYDFGSDAEAWPSIDDVVMGGVSRSEMTVAGGVAVFAGELSLENNGGFASVRSRPDEHALDGFDGIRLRVRGDGRTYGFRFRTTASFDGVSYQAPLPTRAGEWTEVELPFAGFEPVFRGRRVRDHPALDPGSIQTLGVIIADKNPGDFRLEIDHIEAYRD